MTITTTNPSEEKNHHYSDNNKKISSFDLLDPSIIKKLEKMENVGPAFQSDNINNIVNILFKNHEMDLVTYLDFKLKLSILEQLVNIENKLDNID